MSLFKSQPKPHFNKKIILAVQKFVNSRTWTDARKVVEDNRHLLFTNEADAILKDMVERYSGSIWGSEAFVIREHRELLAKCRKEGIEAGFAPYQPKKRK